MDVNILIKGWYKPPTYPNRFKINWPHSILPNKGDYFDVRPFLPEELNIYHNDYDKVYRVDMIQWEDQIYICLIPTK